MSNVQINLVVFCLVSFMHQTRKTILFLFRFRSDFMGLFGRRSSTNSNSDRSSTRNGKSMKTSASKAISILSEIKLDSHSSHSGSNQPSNIPTSPTEEHLLAT